MSINPPTLPQRTREASHSRFRRWDLIRKKVEKDLISGVSGECFLESLPGATNPILIKSDFIFTVLQRF